MSNRCGHARIQAAHGISGAILTVVASIVISGCSNLPESINDCIDKSCEAKVLKREDGHHKRRMLLEEKEKCRYPLIWEARTRFHGYCTRPMGIY